MIFLFPRWDMFLFRFRVSFPRRLASSMGISFIVSPSPLRWWTPPPDIRHHSFFVFLMLSLRVFWVHNISNLTIVRGCIFATKTSFGTTKYRFFFQTNQQKRWETKQTPWWNMLGVKVLLSKKNTATKTTLHPNCEPKCRCFSASNLAALLFKPSCLKPTQVEEFQSKTPICKP